MVSYYMHTIGGRPASFNGTQIVCMHFYGKPNKVCRSLKEIRRHERRALAYRKDFGVSPTAGEYGYFRIGLPE